jgi:hypothetical protein
MSGNLAFLIPDVEEPERTARFRELGPLAIAFLGCDTRRRSRWPKPSPMRRPVRERSHFTTPWRRCPPGGCSPPRGALMAPGGR